MGNWTCNLTDKCAKRNIQKTWPFEFLSLAGPPSLTESDEVRLFLEPNTILDQQEIVCDLFLNFTVPPIFFFKLGDWLRPVSGLDSRLLLVFTLIR